MDTSDSITELSEEECWERLSGNSLGRLATAVAGNPDIFPVNYYADRKTLLIRTAPGTKLLELTIHHDVAFEIDGYTDDEAWSVIVKGVAEQLESQTEIDEADRQPLAPWIPTLKYRYVRITPHTISGRRFRREAEPQRYWSSHHHFRPATASGSSRARRGGAPESISGSFGAPG